MIAFLIAPQTEPSLAAFAFASSLHMQRRSGGMTLMTWLTCAPQPAQVVLWHTMHSTGLHMPQE